MKQDKKLLAGPAHITIARRESSGLNSFEVWDFYLNGENIGSIQDGDSVTVGTNQRDNILEAKSPKGTVSELRFSVQSGGDPEVRFNAGVFQNSQGMDIIIPPDEPEAFAKIRGNFKSITKGLIFLVILIGYYAAVILLFGGQKILEFVLFFLPVLGIGLFSRSIYMEMVNYICNNLPEAWGRIARDQAEYSFWRHRGILAFDEGVGDLEYLELRKQYKRVLLASGLLRSYYL